MPANDLIVEYTVTTARKLRLRRARRTVLSAATFVVGVVLPSPVATVVGGAVGASNADPVPPAVAHIHVTNLADLTAMLADADAARVR